MNCRRVEQLLSHYLEGALPTRDAAMVTAHLHDCEACRRCREEILAAEAELSRLIDPAPPHDLECRAVERWVAERETAPSPLHRCLSVFAGGRSQKRGSRSIRGSKLVAAVSVGMAASLLVLLIPRLVHRASSRPAQHAMPSFAQKPHLQHDSPEWQVRADQAGRDLRRFLREMSQREPFGTKARKRQGSKGEATGTAQIWRPTAAFPSRFRVKNAGSLQPAAPADDLAHLNGDAMMAAQMWARLSPDEWATVEARVRHDVRVREDFIQIPFPRLAAATDRQVAAAVETYKREAGIVDARLSREVTLQSKATALADVCDQLRAATGIRIEAGRSVADEKVTIFCEKMPLREVMRQLSRPFGYTWVRSSREGEYRYELAQDLRSQLVEEELRNRDRNAALLALEKEIERYRPYLNLTPDEALARSKSAAPGDKELLEKLAGPGWGALQMYPRLSSQELAALRAGEAVMYVDASRTGEQPRPAWLAGGVLPAEVGRGVLQSMRVWRLVKSRSDSGVEGYEYTPDGTLPGALPPAAIPEARAYISLRIYQGELGQFVLSGRSGLFTMGSTGHVYYNGANSREAASGMSPLVLKADNATANASLARDPAMQPRFSIQPIVGSRSPGRSIADLQASRTAGQPPDAQAGEGRITSADALEALHRATGMPIVADFYTRLHKPQAVTIKNQSLFEALNHLADTMRMRWNKEGAWLRFRSTSFYDDRLKEVPNRLLARWAESRRQHGALTLDDLCEIVQLSDAQLNGAEMAEGARELWGLAEWGLARTNNTRPHLRFLAACTPEQRQEATSVTGLLFTRLPLAQQQQFLQFGLTGGSLQSVDELGGTSFRVDYVHPGGFQWGEPGWSGFYTRWVVPMGPGPSDRRVPRPPVHERTREAALAAVRRVDLALRESLLQAVRRADPRVDGDLNRFDEQQIFPTQRELIFVAIPGSANARPIKVWNGGTDGECHYRQR